MTTATIDELKTMLGEFPGHWLVFATKAGGSLEVWDPDGPKYAYVFTYNDKPPRHMTRRDRGRMLA